MRLTLGCMHQYITVINFTSYFLNYFCEILIFKSFSAEDCIFSGGNAIICG